MSETPVFKSGAVKQALGWLVFIGGGVALAALIYAIAVNIETQSQADLWSGVVIGLFIGLLMLGGLSLQSQRWSLEGDAIVLHRLFGKKVIPLSGLAGFGKTTVIVSMFPLVQMDIYDRDLKPVTRLPVTMKDAPMAETLLATRLRYVVNEGSAALPKRRFVD